MARKGFTQPHKKMQGEDRRAISTKVLKGIAPRSRRESRGAGFTLIETIVYLGILALIMSVAFIVSARIMESERTASRHAEVQEEARFLMGKIMWIMNGAQIITAPPPGATSTALAVVKFNFPENPIMLESGSGVARIAVGTNPAVPLTSANVRVSSLVFTHIPQTGSRPPGIRVTLSLETTFPGAAVQSATTLENVLYLRK
ncbi:MAG: type II secretion system protein [Parcubacteria group bacterium]|nr:type II secretion system protein [Parcubacteria group bacterium]